MKTKRDVFGIVGIVLFVLAMSVIIDYGNFVSGEMANENMPYEEIIANIDDSLMKTYSNNDKLKSLNDDLQISQNILDSTLKNYTSLGEEIKKINEDIKQIRREINKTNDDSNKLKEKRMRLQNQIENDNKRIETDTGLKSWLFYLSLFISVNLFIWFEISTYYKERSFRYGKF